jgi:hypothetical protein
MCRASRLNVARLGKELNIKFKEKENQMSPQKVQGNMKGTSPSKFINNAIDQAWGAQDTKSNTDPKKAVSESWNKNPVDLAPGADTKKTPTS